MRMPLRVPCDGSAALEAALSCRADAWVLDLGAVLPGDGRAARRRIALDILLRVAAPAGSPQRIVRVAALSSGGVDADLDGVMAGEPDAILLPGAVGGADVQHLAAKLAVREAEHGTPVGRTGIVALAADTARGTLALPTIPGAGPRLLALGWDRDATAADLRAGVAASPCRLARALLLTAAAAAGVPALDLTSRGDAARLRRDCAAARRDGFAGKLALGPDQVAVIGGWFPPEAR